MYVCLCKGITDKQIKEAVEKGASCIRSVRSHLDLATQCCKCVPMAREIIEETLANQAQENLEPLYYSA